MFILVLFHYLLDVVINLFVDTQEWSGEELPRKDVILWHVWVVLICLLLEMKTCNARDFVFVFSFFDVLILLFDLLGLKLVLSLTNTNFGAHEFFVNFQVVEGFVLKKN